MDSPNSAGVPPRAANILKRSVVRRLVKYALIAAGIVVLLGSIAPFINASRYGERIKASLEASLGRKVSIGRVHFTLFAGPGFTVEDVTIGEDPRYGIEPCAYVPLLEARVRLDKLLQGRVQFLELRLEGYDGVEPTLNLVKRGDGTWNVVELIERLGHGIGYWNFLPALEIDDARLNFKLGDRKSALYVDDADIVAYTESSGKVRMRFSGTPSRTDRSGHGFSSFQGEANWYPRPSAANPNQLEANVNLQQSNLSEMITLVQGYDIGIHGYVSGRLDITGPARALLVHGDMHLDDVHRWDLTPSSGESWNVRFGGSVDLAHNRIQLETAPDARKTNPVTLQVRVNDFLTEPNWSILALLKKAPAENLLPLSRRLGIGLPSGLTAKGLVNGAVGYSNRSGWNGSVALEGVTATVPGLPPFNAPSTTVSIASDRIHVSPSLVESPAGASLLISGDYIPSTRALAINLKAKDSPVTSLTAALASWFGEPPVFPSFQSGVVTGQVRYAEQPPAEPGWSGEFQVSKGTLAPQGLGGAIHDFSGRFSLSDYDLDVNRFSADVAGHAITGDYHYRAKALRKERLRVQTSSVDLVAVEKLLEPALGPRDFFSRFRFGRRSLPTWLAHRSLEADAAVGDLSIGGTKLGPTKFHFVWLGPSIDLSSIRVQLPEGEILASGSINLANVHPRYSLSGQASNLPWKGGLVNIDGQATASGFGTDVLAGLQAAGDFEGHDLTPAQDVHFAAITGKYTLSFDSGWPNLQLTEVSAEQPEETWQGTGSSDKDGALTFDLADGPKALRVVSTLDPALKIKDSLTTTATDASR